MDSERISRLRGAIVWAAIIAAAHFALGTRTHAVHGLHVVLGGLFLIPVLMAAMAFEVRGGLTAAVAVSSLYATHLVWSWRDATTGNLDQWAMIGVYFVVAVAAGNLVKTANIRKWQRDEVARKSRHTELMRGLTGLLSALAFRDAGTLAHCRRAAAVATKIGERLHLDEEMVTRVRLAALVHDIGKIGVPDDIMYRDGPLTDEQMATMQRHVDLAVNILKPIAGTEDIARIVRMHHECPDGSGYPLGLKAGEITPEANILRVADVFSALTEARPYHAALEPQQAIQQMTEGSGSKIDTAAFEALQAVLMETHGLASSFDGETAMFEATRGRQ